MLTGAKALVTYFKQSGLVNLLTKSEQDSETEWNSKLQMLITIHQMYNKIAEILTEWGGTNCLDNIHMDFLPALNFLTPFKEASLASDKEN